MINESYAKIYPDTCLFNDVKGYADLSKDTAAIAEVDFTTENSLVGTRAYISFTASFEKDTIGTITAEVVDKDSNTTVGKSILSVDDLKSGKEARVPFFTDKGNLNYTLKTTSTISKGGLFATLKYEVG